MGITRPIAALAGVAIQHLPTSSIFSTTAHFRRRTLIACAAAVVGLSLLASVALGATGRISPDLHEMNDWGAHARAAKVMLILFQIAALLAAAKLLGWGVERLKVPGVIGELLGGVLVGPYLLGSWVHVPLGGHGSPLFPMPIGTEWPINEVVWTIAQIASVILLFITGLHTDLQQFLKYLRPAMLIALAGLIVPFGLGAAVVYIPPFAALAGAQAGEGPLVPALFVGAILAATSIGITARVLGDIDKLDTPEGVTILGAAVLDDVLGIIALAIVVGIKSAGTVSVGAIGLIAAKAFGFWIGLTLLVLLLSKPIERALNSIRYPGATVGLGLVLAFVGSGLAESFGLAFIIGAYSVGLGLSRTDLAHRLIKDLEPIGAFVVPIFFAALGMLVNVKAMFSSVNVALFGVVVTAAAVIGKLAGCGLAARYTGFNRRGAYRIGLGMLPRGEVALIVAGIGLAQGIVGEVVFGVSIMMTLVTTLLAPLLLIRAFRTGGGGRRTIGAPANLLPGESVLPPFVVQVTPSLSRMFIDRLLSHAEAAGWHPSYDRADENIYLLRSGADAAQVTVAGESIKIDASDIRQREFVAFADAARSRLIADADAVQVQSPLVAPSSDPIVLHSERG